MDKKLRLEVSIRLQEKDRFQIMDNSLASLTEEFSRYVSQKDLHQLASDYVETNWNSVQYDLARLIAIDSSLPNEAEPKDEDHRDEGPETALNEMLDIAEGYGYITGREGDAVGWAELPGDTDTQLGVIAHVDVVPAGPGWQTKPFELQMREKYYVARGVLDDKGPLMVTFHALNLWRRILKRDGKKFPYTVRFIFGASEETGMDDVKVYRAKHADPTFLFTPDAEFPVCYGEKGMLQGILCSAPLGEGNLVTIQGGLAPNAVPGVASCCVRVDADALPSDFPEEAGVFKEMTPQGLVLTAQGKAAHASTPWLGDNALSLLVDYLLGAHLLSGAEEEFFTFARQLLAVHDGSGLGIAAQDNDFGPLTAVGSVCALDHGRLSLSFDCRFPTTITADEIVARVNEQAASAHATFYVTTKKKPFLVDAAAPEIQALKDAYNEVTGLDAQPFTMGGGTYARAFTRAASFGLEVEDPQAPAWAGGMHGPNEAVSVEWLKKSFEIYFVAFAKLNSIVLGE